MEAIILAGGLGTRLSSVVNDVPKCMAPVNGKPFLAYLLNYLEDEGCDHVVLSLGYKHEAVIEWLRNNAFLFKTDWVIEKEPLGTGGGIKLAMHKCKEQHVLVLNGDTMFKIDLKKMVSKNEEHIKALIALKPMEKFDRYGAVVMDATQYISGFEEKQFKENGLINGGIYLINRQHEDFSSFPEKFSFEKDFLEKQAGKKSLKGFVSESYFLDIGIPEDYARAQIELAIE